VGRLPACAAYTIRYRRCKTPHESHNIDIAARKSLSDRTWNWRFDAPAIATGPAIVNWRIDARQPFAAIGLTGGELAGQFEIEWPGPLYDGPRLLKSFRPLDDEADR
jgi:hypothetical protein